MTDTVAVTSRRREATRQKLLDAAAQVFAEVGLDAASVEAVCERAGFTRGAFYSNFETKDDLFLELSGMVAREKVDGVRARVAELERQGVLADANTDPLTIVQQVLDVAADDRVGVLLMSEIRIHALRNPDLARAYLAQEDAMRLSVAQIITDIARAGAMRFRISPEEASGLLFTAFEAGAVRAVMEGRDAEALRRCASEEIALVARLIIEIPPRS